MADHSAKLDYFGGEAIAAMSAAVVGDVVSFPLLLTFAVPVIGIPIGLIGAAIHWFTGLLMLVFVAPKLGLSEDLKEAAETIAATQTGGAAGGPGKALRALDISAWLRWGSSLVLLAAYIIPLPLLTIGLVIAVALHNKLIDFVVTQIVVIAASVVATPAAGAAVEGAALAGEAAVAAGEAAAAGAAAAEGAGAAAAAAEAGAGTAARGAAAGAQGAAGEGTGAALGERAAEKEAATGAKEVPKEALGEQRDEFEKLRDLFQETPAEPEASEREEENDDDETETPNPQDEEASRGDEEYNSKEESRLAAQ